MKTKVCLLLVCLFAVTGLALAQAKVDGKWTAEIQGGRGPQMVTITLKNDAGKLTGTVEGGRGGSPFPLKKEPSKATPLVSNKNKWAVAAKSFFSTPEPSAATKSSSSANKRAAKACPSSSPQSELSKSQILLQ